MAQTLLAVVDHALARIVSTRGGCGSRPRAHGSGRGRQQRIAGSSGSFGSFSLSPFLLVCFLLLLLLLLLLPPSLPSSSYPLFNFFFPTKARASATWWQSWARQATHVGKLGQGFRAVCQEKEAAGGRRRKVRKRKGERKRKRKRRCRRSFPKQLHADVFPPIRSARISALAPRPLPPGGSPTIELQQQCAQADGRNDARLGRAAPAAGDTFCARKSGHGCAHATGNKRYTDAEDN